MTTKRARALPGPARAPYFDGNLVGYANEQDSAWDGYTWVDNEPFEATLELYGQERGRSAMRFLWRDASQAPGHAQRFPMFATDMIALIQSKDGAAGGTATGWWVVMKRGANYGIARYEP